MTRSNIVLSAVAITIVACAPSPSTTVGSSAASAVGTNSSASNRRADSMHVSALESEARVIAKVAGCKANSECRNAPVGVKACGGPRYYLPYCAATTDTAALFAKLDEVASAERAYNKKYNVVSTCQMMLPSRPHFERGACR